MTDQATYTREQIALDDARFTMLAHRLTERAQEYANTLPHETIRQRVAANEITERVRGMRELTRLLGHFMEEKRADGGVGEVW